jgi:hypothetical protein
VVHSPQARQLDCDRRHSHTVHPFVVYSFKPKHPVLDLRLFRNRNLTVSIATMFIFAAAFFGGLLTLTHHEVARGRRC